MLPSESIRFFCLDWFWVESLLDGAFSIGRVQDTDVEPDSRQNPLTGEAKHISGFLIRSDVIAGWPDLQIEGSEFSIAGATYQSGAKANCFTVRSPLRRRLTLSVRRSHSHR